MSLAKSLKWGICSAGKISHDFVTAMKALDLPACSGNEAVAVAARSLESAQKFAKDHNISSAHGSYEELATNPNVDIIYVGCITSEHHRLCLMYLNAGKSVLCEKSLTTNVTLARELVETATQKQVFFMEAFWSCFFPATGRLLKEIRSGTHGDVRYMTCEFGKPISHVDRINKKELGGGALLDIGCYVVLMACIVFKGKKIKEIVARGSLLPSGVDANATITIVYEDGAIASLGTNTQIELSNSMRVYTEKKTFVLPDPMHCPTQLEIVGEDTLTFPLCDDQKKYNYDRSAGLSYQIAAVKDCIDKGLTQCPDMTLEDSLQILEIIDEARRQIEANI